MIFIQFYNSVAIEILHRFKAQCACCIFLNMKLIEQMDINFIKSIAIAHQNIFSGSFRASQFDSASGSERFCF